MNNSAEQIRHARDWCKGLPVTILDCDYRDIQGCFDKVVSVGMFEHVGSRNYRQFMEVVTGASGPEGLPAPYDRRQLLHDRCDPWINRYIFPNGCCLDCSITGPWRGSSLWRTGTTWAPITIKR